MRWPGRRVRTAVTAEEAPPHELTDFELTARLRRRELHMRQVLDRATRQIEHELLQLRGGYRVF